MPIHNGESREDYLETILILEREKGFVRSVDVAERMGFSKPSVSRATGLLREASLITMEKDGQIHLTEAGRAFANQIYERHCTLKNFLVQLGVSEETAEQDACRVEHFISEETFEKIKEHYPLIR